MTQPIWYDSSETGAPTLNNAPGSMLEVLRSCLINGFNPKSVTSIAVASGVATVTCATHGFSGAYGKLVLIEGSPEALLNGRKQPASITTNTFTFPAAGVADGTYTGTITAKRAPLGWQEVHTGSNKAIFGRTDPAALTQMLRVDDSHVSPSTLQSARVVMVESATDVDTFTNPSPTAAQVSGGGHWHKGPNSDTPKRWALIGTSRAFWFFVPATYSASPQVGENAPMFFGDGVPYRLGDSHFCLLAAASATFESLGQSNTQIGTVSAFNVGGASAASTKVARDRAGSALSVDFVPVGPQASSQIGRGGQTVTDVIVIHAPIWVLNDFSAARELRGEIPGLAAPLADRPYESSGAFHVVDSVANTDRTYLSVMMSSAASFPGNVLIDLTGPWY